MKGRRCRRNTKVKKSPLGNNKSCIKETETCALNNVNIQNDKTVNKNSSSVNSNVPYNVQEIKPSMGQLSPLQNEAVNFCDDTGETKPLSNCEPLNSQGNLHIDKLQVTESLLNEEKQLLHELSTLNCSFKSELPENSGNDTIFSQVKSDESSNSTILDFVPFSSFCKSEKADSVKETPSSKDEYDDSTECDSNLLTDWEDERDEKTSVKEFDFNEENSNHSSVISTVGADYVCYENNNCVEINEEALLQRLVFEIHSDGELCKECNDEESSEETERNECKNCIKEYKADIKTGEEPSKQVNNEREFEEPQDKEISEQTLKKETAVKVSYAEVSDEETEIESNFDSNSLYVASPKANSDVDEISADIKTETKLNDCQNATAERTLSNEIIHQIAIEAIPLKSQIKSSPVYITETENGELHNFKEESFDNVKKEDLSDDLSVKSESSCCSSSSRTSSKSETTQSEQSSHTQYSIVEVSKKDECLKMKFRKLTGSDNKVHETYYATTENVLNENLNKQHKRKTLEDSLEKVKEKIKRKNEKRTIFLDTVSEIPNITQTIVKPIKYKFKGSKKQSTETMKQLSHTTVHQKKVIVKQENKWEKVLRSRVKNSSIKNATIDNGNIPMECTSNYSSDKIAISETPDYKKGIPAPSPFPKPSVPISLNHLLAKIGSWNVTWLDEQKMNVDPPPDIASSARKPSLSYVCYDEYFDTYCPLLMLEIWQFITDCWQRRDITHRSIISVSVLSHEITNDVIILHCQTLLRDQGKLKKNFPFLGHLVILHLNLHDCDNQAQVFGYVVDHKVENIIVDSHYNQIYSSPKEEESIIVSLTIKTQAREGKLNFCKPTMIENICFLKPLIIQAEALLNVHNSLLINNILCPQERTCNTVKQNKFSVLGSYSMEQRKIVLDITEDIYSQHPHVSFISGPAGSGKTHIIIALIQQLLCNDCSHKMKLLVTARTHCAVEEIGCRLARLQQSFLENNQKELRFVHVGNADYAHPDLQAHCIENLISYNIKRNKEDLQYNEIKLLAVENDIATLKKQLQSCIFGTEICSAQEKVEKMLLDRETYQNRLNYLRTKPHKDEEKARSKMRIEILENADIILTTVQDSRCSALVSVYSSTGLYQFKCCIVDDATQLTEIETLIPLLYDINKLVLIGDSQQLSANIRSMTARKYGYQQSFFERCQEYFQNLNDNVLSNNFYLLNEQYRMHSDICYYSSAYFYQNSIITPQHVDKYRSFLNIYPCIIFDITDGQTSIENPFNIFNLQEAHFVIHLYSEICRYLKCNWSAGIITPYVGQCDILKKHLPKDMKEKHSVEIGTIECFHGREKDIIILSCVQTNHTSKSTFLSDPQLFNVAITRAKNLLIICGSTDYLQKWPLWKMFIKEASNRNILIHTKSTSNNIITQLLKRN